MTRVSKEFVSSDDSWFNKTATLSRYFLDPSETHKSPFFSRFFYFDIAYVQNRCQQSIDHTSSLHCHSNRIQ